MKFLFQRCIVISPFFETIQDTQNLDFGDNLDPFENCSAYIHFVQAVPPFCRVHAAYQVVGCQLTEDFGPCHEVLKIEVFGAMIC